jgi:hypothetical protein
MDEQGVRFTLSDEPQAMLIQNNRKRRVALLR